MRSAAKEVPLYERDREAADDWMRDHLPDPEQFGWQDNEEEGDTQSYFFLRYRDAATVVYKVAVKDGKVTSRAEIQDTTVPTECQRKREWIYSGT